MEKISITQIPGFQIGHAQSLGAATDCTVAICEKGVAAGVDVRGGSPGMCETDALDPVDNRREVHAVLFAGGSAFGLDVVGGVMRYLEEHRVGRDVKVTYVSNVSGAILFDLKCGSAMVRPDAEMGYLACRNAGVFPLEEDSVGVGTGCTVEKTLGKTHATKGGIGICAFRQGDLMVGAVIAINCVGDICDRESGRILAGVSQDGHPFPGGSEEIIVSSYQGAADFFSGNTVIGCVITSAKLEKAQARKLASVSRNGIARTVRPAHSVFDDDTLFTLCSGEVAANFDAVGILSAYAVEQAILQVVKKVASLGGYPSYQDAFVKSY